MDEPGGLGGVGGLHLFAVAIQALAGSDADHAAILETLDEMMNAATTEDRRGELLAELGDGFVQASGNRVLRLIRHGLRSRYSNYVLPDRRRAGIGHELLVPHLERLARAIRQRDGAEAGEAIFALTATSRAHIKTALEGERSQTGAVSSHPTAPTEADLAALAAGEKR